MTAADRQCLRPLPKQQRHDEGYVQVTVLLLLAKGRPAASLADELALAQGLTLLFGPPYSPELNRIDMLWRFRKP